MALGFQARAEAAGLECGKVHLERGVDLFAGLLDNADDNQVVRRDVAKIATQYAPKVGALLEHPSGRFRLDRRVADSGYAQKFIVVAVP
jgi:hypothetical protein